MVTQLDEGRRRFSFADGWVVWRYDCEDSGYSGISSALPHTKACDFIGYHPDGVYFVEAKDFRGYRIQNKPRLKQGEVATEVAQKARDTLAGIVAACRRAEKGQPWEKLATLILDTQRRMVVALCVEDDTAKDPRAWKQEMDTQQKLLHKRLKWLNVRGRVFSSSSGACLPDVTVTDLPGAGGHGQSNP